MRRIYPVVTYVLMVICVCITFAIQFVSFGNASENAILFGAYYRPFVLAGEVWRLVTVGLIHVEWVHLVANMMSFYLLGTSLEGRLGHKKFLVLLFGSVVGGSIGTLLFPSVTVAVGLSGGLYGLMAYYGYEVFQHREMLQFPVVRKQILETIAINLIINFLPDIGWQAHLGGFLTGLLLSILLCSEKKSYKAISGVFLALGVTVITILPKQLHSEHMYLGTDSKILEKYMELGLKSHTKKMAKNLDELYGIGTILEEYIDGEN